MKQALLVHGSKQTPVMVEQTENGGLVIWIPNHSPLFVRPMEEADYPQSQPEWIFKDGEDLPENIEPQDHPQITRSDLRPSTPENEAYNWKLIARRFPWLFAKSFGYKQAEKYAEQEAARQMISHDTPTQAKSQLQLDLETIKPYLGEIIRDGRFVYGHQSTIARLLGGTNDGGFRRNRVLPVEAALSKSRLITSATSTQQVEPWSNYPHFDHARQARSK